MIFVEKRGKIMKLIDEEKVRKPRKKPVKK